MKIRTRSVVVSVLLLALVGVMGIAAYLAGYQSGLNAPREYIRGYTILTPEPIKPTRPESDRSDLDFDDYARTPDILYGDDPAHNKLDLYVPSGSPGKRPAVISIHGGGTSATDKGRNPSPWAIPLLRGGIAVVEVDYRPFFVTTSPDNSRGFAFPAQIDDCKTAIRFLRANAAKFNLDPGRIGVIGHSFGGYLATLIATTGEIASFGGAPLHPEQNSAVIAACCIAGMTDMRCYMKQADAHRFALGLDWPELDTTGHFYVLPMSDSQKERASAVCHVDPKDPPTLIVQGFDDPSVPPHQGDLLYVKLRNARVDATCLMIPGAGHGGPPLETPSTREAVADFFRKHLSIDGVR